MGIADHPDFGPWARRAVAGLKDSACMVGVLDDSPELADARYEFQLQIGHCLVADKPVILLVPHGTRIPEKLRVAATVIEYYEFGNQDSLHAATTRALKAIGIEREH